MARPKIVITGEDKTKPAFESVKRGLADVVDASGKATGSLERFLKLSPKMLAIGAAGAAVGLTFRSVYKNSEDLKSASENLGSSWAAMTGSLGNTAPVRAAAEAMNALANAIRPAQALSVAEWADEQVSALGRMAVDIQSKLATKQKWQTAAFWLPSTEDLKAQLDAINSEIVKKATETNALITDLRKKGFDPREFAPLSDSQWKDIQDQSTLAYAQIKAAEKDKATSVNADIERQREAARGLADDYMRAYTATRTPQEEFIAALQRANELFQEFGDPDLFSRSVGAARDNLTAATGREEKAANPALSLVGNDLSGVDSFLQSDTQALEAEYQKRADIAALAYSAGLTDLQGYKDREMQLWAHNEAAKSAITMREAENRKAIDDTEFQQKISAANNVAGILGSLASLSEGRGKKEFQTAQRLARAQTIVNTAAMAISAGRDTPGPWPVKAAAVAAALFAGAAQLNKINETQYSGGGSIASATGGGAGGAVPGTSGGGGTAGSNETAVAPASRGVTKITILANNNGIAYLDYASIVSLGEQIRAAGLRGDLIIMDPQSANAQAIAAQAQAQAA